ncbi:hypothetical protein D8B46_05965 [Candidatus Gracilibacteria bacterium]|nr:hypothetical protein [Candidatus Gracilibacteria bacterium]MBF0913766.1 hypothetical protein [Candidatus Gracilibacteria bacterium]RKW22130.1 MAG: hypothetical protein D8B46_05965 [Candidatus Gracilibacteria bacterium]
MGLRLENGNFTLGIFDFDGNILRTDTPVYFKNNETGEIEKFSMHFVDQNQKDFFGNDSKYSVVSETYSECRDFFSLDYHRGFDGIIQDVLNAIEENNFAQSYEVFKNAYLIKARMFAILTARGNSPDNFHRAFSLINEKTLTKEQKEQQHENIIKNYRLDPKISREEALYYYLGKVINYVPCNNFQVEKLMGFAEEMPSCDRKAKAMDFLLSYYINLLENIYKKNISEIIGKKQYFSVGFSDDNLKNIVSVYEKFRVFLDSEKYFPEVQKKFSVYFTGKSEEYYNLLMMLGDEEHFREQIKQKYGLKIKLKK